VYKTFFCFFQASSVALTMDLTSLIIDLLPEREQKLLQAIRKEAYCLQQYLRFPAMALDVDKEWVEIQLSNTRARGENIARKVLLQYR